MRLRAAVMTVALATSAICAMSQMASASTVDATCNIRGSAAMSPGLTDAPQAQDFRLSGTIDGQSGCPAFMSSAHFNGSLHSDSMSCDGMNLLGEPARGRVRIAWPDKTVSKLRMSLAGGKKGLIKLTGLVKSGKFVGDHFSAHVRTSVRNGVCSQSVITAFSFLNSGGPSDRPLTFSHD